MRAWYRSPGSECRWRGSCRPIGDGDEVRVLRLDVDELCPHGRGLVLTVPFGEDRGQLGEAHATDFPA